MLDATEVRRSLARCEDCQKVARMLGLVTGLPKSLLRATANASGAALGAAAASLSSSVLNKGVRLLFDRVLPLMLEVSNPSHAHARHAG